MIEKVDDGYGECEGCGYLGASVVREREARARVEGELRTVVNVQVRCGHCGRTRWVRKEAGEGEGESEDTDSAGAFSVAPGGAGGPGVIKYRAAGKTPCPVAGCGGRMRVTHSRTEEGLRVRWLACVRCGRREKAVEEDAA